ncbi:MAG: hypothetical protein ACREHD_29805 [Pirellulales bacterium]
MTIKTSTELWDRLVSECTIAGTTPAAIDDFLGAGVDRIGMLRDALRRPGGNNRAAALVLLRKMTSNEQQQLLPELVQLARAAHGPVAEVRKIIASLPREWALPRIDAEIARLLDEENYDDYWMLIELLAELDRDRAVKLARRAAESADADVRELGLEKLAGLSCGGDSR